MQHTKLHSLSDDELLRQLADVLKQSRRIESVLVAHIAEVDRRRLYAHEAMPSMFQYCVDVLRLSKAEAYLRIEVARASRKFPVLLTMLADGRLHLSAIERLAPHLTSENCDELLKRATHKTKDQVQLIVAELKPKPDVPSTIRKRPERKAKATTPPSSELRLDGAAQEQPKPVPRPVVEPLAPARYKVEFTASQELRNKLKRLEALMPGSDLAAVIDAAVSEKLDRVEAKRYGKTNKPRKSVDEAESTESRYIPAPMKRAVCERDQNQCTHIGTNGRRCPERERLEFHHDKAYALGGATSIDNIRLVCRAHNLLQAELDFGKEHMSQYRRPA